MDSAPPIEDTKPTNVSRFSDSSRGIIWCFIPVDVDAISSCSIGFREFFGLMSTYGSDIHLPLSSPWLNEALGRRGITVDFLRQLRTESAGLPTTRMKIQTEENQFLQVSAETILNASGHPTGRMITIEPTPFALLSPETMERLATAKARLKVLSPRETEILDLVFEGLTNKAIGLRSEISEKTVEKHRSNIMQKLGIRNSTELIRCVCEAKLGEEAIRKLESR